MSIYNDLVPGDDNPSDPILEPTQPQPQEDKLNGKPIYQSKIFWINCITAVAGVVASLAGSDLIQSNPEWAGYAATLLGVVNIVLRLITVEPVRLVK